MEADDTISSRLLPRHPHREVFLSRRATERYAAARGWAGELYEWRRGLLRHVRSRGVVHPVAPDWVKAFGMAHPCLVVDASYALPIVPNETFAGQGAKPWTAVTCLRHPAVPPPEPRPVSPPAPRPPIPISVEAVLTGLRPTRHCLARYGERCGLELGEAELDRRLRETLREDGRIERRPPSWLLAAPRSTDFFLCTRGGMGPELALPVVWDTADASRPWVAVTAVTRDGAIDADDPAHEAAQLLAETDLPTHLTARYARALGLSPAMARATLARALRQRGRAADDPPPWAEDLSGADCYLVLEDEVCLALVYTGADPRRPLLAQGLVVADGRAA
jgi:hypothetical protein